MKYILILGFLLTGCGTETEERIVCDNFSTPWSYIAVIDDGSIYWRPDRRGSNAVRKMIQGEICRRESRKI